MKLFLVILLAATFFSSFGQDDNLKLGKVLYEFSHVRDTNNRAKYYQEEMLLYFSIEMSQYKSYTKILSDSLFKKQFQTAVAEQGSDDVNLGKIDLKGSNEEIFYFKNKNEISSLKPFHRIKYVINDTGVGISWTVMDSIKNIGGYTCQKATTKFRGRTYEAWFAPELPFPFGPWKLHGLPGIILEASDSNNEVIFKFKLVEVEKQLSLNDRIALPTSIIITTEKELQRTINAYLDGAKNASNSDDVQVTLKRASGKGSSTNKKNKFNNPIQLSE